jgi:hypothetical protein
MIHLRTLAAALLPLVLALPASAQSLFATRGLGVPAPPVDARAAALGGIGLGLIGFNTSLVNPAEIAGITRRGVSAAVQPITTNVDVEGAESGTAATRFPVLRMLYPVSARLVASLAYGSYLEQSWGITTQSQQEIGGQVVTATDVLRARGGIAQLRLGAAYTVTPTFAVGAAAGLLTGNIERIAVRAFSGDTLELLRPFEQRLSWRYLAPIAAVGARWDVGGFARLSASAMTGGRLEAEGVDGTATDRSYGAPLEVAGGASAQVSPLVTVNAGTVWSRVPSTEGSTVASESLRIGGGVEYQGVRSGLRTYPVRLGARWEQLPYYLQGETQPTEWAAGVGLGFRLGDPANPAALADLAVERGARSGLGGGAVSGVNEQIWRFTFSLSLFGN